jgi:hypothetical protein
MNDFYVTEPLGPQQAMTPEGFLVVKSVPLARTGRQLYSDKEIPIKGDAQGKIIIDREPEEVFRPATIASLQGKPITLDHPSDDVNPDNYHDLAVGHVLNPRRGTGVFDHLLIGDLMITDKKAIEAIRNKLLREVSVGYRADYEETGDARGRQRNILCNHLALVKDGRCGPVCRIGDKAFFVVTQDQEEDDSDDGKLSHAEVDYEVHATGPDHCGICTHYGSHSCDTVSNPIYPEGWCNRFDAAVRSRKIANSDRRVTDWSRVNEIGEKILRRRAKRGRHVHIHV